MAPFRGREMESVCVCVCVCVCVGTFRHSSCSLNKRILMGRNDILDLTLTL